MSTPRQRINLELLLGISATFLSLAALIVSIFQTKIAREQQQASVWPYLQAGGSHEEDDFTLTVVNNGVGPALIKKVGYTYKGVSYPDQVALLDAAEKKALPDSVRLKGGHFYSSFSSGDVLKAGDAMELYIVKHNERKASVLEKVVRDSSFHMQIVFSDVYNNCWQLDQNKVTSLGKCD
ncbi:hypothetical protein [Spirosoma koreense]